jgi:hypothetical protein
MANILPSEEELNEYTGVPTPMTPGKAILSSLKDTIGYAVDPSSAILNLTKKETLKQLGRVAAHHKKLVFDGRDFEQLPSYTLRRLDRNVKRARALAAEIRTMPEELLGPVRGITTTARGEVSHVKNRSNVIALDPFSVEPGVFRHELAHIRQKTLPNFKGFYSNDYPPYSSPFWGRVNTKIPTSMARTVHPEKFYGYHSVVPTEISAEDMRGIPLNIWKNAEQYDKYLQKYLDEATDIGAERFRAIRRKLRYNTLVEEATPEYANAYGDY